MIYDNMMSQLILTISQIWLRCYFIAHKCIYVRMNDV